MAKYLVSKETTEDKKKLYDIISGPIKPDPIKNLESQPLTEADETYNPSGFSKFFKAKIKKIAPALGSTVEYDKIRCDSCGNFQTYSPEIIPTKCHICGHMYDEPKQINTIVPEDAKPHTHNQIRVVCHNCNYNAIVWVQKGINKIQCPNCKVLNNKIAFSKIKSEGDCISEDMWGLDFLNKSPKPKKKIFPCKKCNFLNPYLIRPPILCNNCGQELKSNTPEDNTPL
jgi:ribosomal protein S27E